MSKSITVNIPHNLGRPEARRRIEEGFERLAGQLGSGVGAIESSWAGDRMSFALKMMGQTISGVLEVADEAIRLDVVLPGFLGVIAEKLKGRLRKEGQVLLEQRKP